MPQVVAGLFIGGMLPFLFSALTMRSVGKAAFQMIEEVRRQFKANPKIMEGTEKPDYAKCVDISTAAALKEMVIPGLLAVVSMACVMKAKSVAFVSKRLSEKLGKLWIAAEVMLFVLVGAAVDIRYTLDAGFMAVVMILIALVLRAIGVVICLMGTQLNKKERLFCVIAYLPKATVQAAIGSVPLAMGLSCGKIVLSIAVLAILITAPVGALGIDLSYQYLLVGGDENTPISTL